MLVDTHCHLDFPDFAEDLDAVVARAGEAGVGIMLSIGTHITRYEALLEIAGRFDNVYCTAGIHPHNADSEPEVSVEQLVALAENPKTVGFGETGLDYFYEHSPREAQRKSFRTHIAAARETGLPLVVHTRNADGDIVDILEEEQGRGAFTGLIHCFSSGPEVAKRALAMGFYISLSGIVTFKKADALRAVVSEIPVDRLLVETDAPYLAPVPHRGKRNEPAFTAHTAKAVAAVKGMTASELAEATTANFHRLFTKVPKVS